MRIARPKKIPTRFFIRTQPTNVIFLPHIATYMASFSATRRIVLRGSSTRHLISCSRSGGSSLNYYAVARSLSSVAINNTTHHAPSISYHYPHHSHTMSTVAAAIEEDSDSSDNEEVERPLFSSISELHPLSLHAIEQKMKLKNMTEIQHKTFVAGKSALVLFYHVISSVHYEVANHMH